MRQRMKNITKYGHKCKPISYWLLKMISISIKIKDLHTYLAPSYTIQPKHWKKLSQRIFIVTNVYTDFIAFFIFRLVVQAKNIHIWVQVQAELQLWINVCTIVQTCLLRKFRYLILIELPYCLPRKSKQGAFRSFKKTT